MSTTTAYQRRGKTDPKDPSRYKRLPLEIVKLTPHTVQMNKGSLLRRSGVRLDQRLKKVELKRGTTQIPRC